MALTESPVIGNECSAYENTGTYGTPTWTEIPKLIDVELGLTKGEADIPSRESKFMLKRASLKEVEITAGYRVKQGADARFDSLRSAYFADTIMDLLFVDTELATETGGQGIRGFFQVYDCSRSEPNADALSANLVFKPTYKEESGSHVDPVWFTIS